MARIYNYLHQSYFANKIQICWRNYVVKIYDRLHGPARRNRNLCVNETDFYTMEKISNISYNQFISYEDVDKMIYGFDILSLYNLLTKKNGITEYTNPYNRNSIPYDLRRNIDRLILFSKIIGEKITVKIDEPEEISTIKRLELKTLSIFHDIDNLGNYTDKNVVTEFPKLNKLLTE